MIISSRRSGRAAMGSIAVAAVLAIHCGAGQADRAKADAPQQITFDAGLTTTPALSRDGTLVAYASDRGGDEQLDLYVQPTSGGRARRLTDDRADDYAPVFSPDARTIAFRSDRAGGGLYEVPAEGGEARLLARRGRSASFSPDGRWIAYWVDEDKPRGADEARGGAMFIVAAAGGPPAPLRSEFAAARSPVWSPDGRFLLFAGAQASGDEDEWWVTPREGGVPTRTGAVSRLRSRGYRVPKADGFVWITGDRLVFFADVNGRANVWELTLAPGTWQAGAPRRVTSGPGLHNAFSVAADGRVAYASGSFESAIWAVALNDDGSAAARLERLTQPLLRAFNPSLTADEGQLAFETTLGEEKAEVWVKDLRQPHLSLVTTGAGPLWPLINGDGSAIAYLGPSGLRVAWARTRRAETVCAPCVRPLAWTSDGGRLLTLRGDRPSAVSAIDLSNGRSEEVIDGEAIRIADARLSRDDRWIAFEAGGAGEGRLYVAPFAAGGPIAKQRWIAVTDGETLDTTPRWSADARMLYFASERDGSRCVWAQPLEADGKRPAGAAFAVRHFHGAQRSMSAFPRAGLDVAGDRLAIHLTAETGNIWMTRLN